MGKQVEGRGKSWSWNGDSMDFVCYKLVGQLNSYLIQVGSDKTHSVLTFAQTMQPLLWVYLLPIMFQREEAGV